MDGPLEVLILGLISTQLLWEGEVLAKLPGYDLNAPDKVSVEEGLCVIIPCDFTYHAADARRFAKLYGFWYEKGSSYDHDSPVATNSLKPVAGFAANRFHLIGNLDKGNCSLLISNAQKTDAKSYYFRMEKENRAKFSFNNDYIEPVLYVTDRQAPEIQILGKLRAGHPANITCATFRSCSWQSPTITWKGFSKNINHHMWLNGTQAYSSVLDFLPSVADHNRNLTCIVTYINVSSPVYKEKSVQLDVNFPPQTPVISVERLPSNKGVRNFTKASYLKIKNGDSILLRCKVKGNPLPNVTWVKGSQLLGTSLPSYNVLNISGMKEEDAGEYKCQAANIEGTAEASFEIFMEQDQNNCLLSLVAGALLMLAVVMLIIGIIFIFKRCQRQRKRVTDSEMEPQHPALAPGTTSPNVKNPYVLDLARQKTHSTPLKPESTEGSADKDPRDPEEMHYATLIFSAPNPIPDATSEEIQSDYAEIKVYSSQEKQGTEI